MCTPDDDLSESRIEYNSIGLLTRSSSEGGFSDRYTSRESEFKKNRDLYDKKDETLVDEDLNRTRGVSVD